MGWKPVDGTLGTVVRVAGFLCVAIGGFAVGRATHNRQLQRQADP